MTANIRGFTPNYNFKLVNFDTPRWHTLEYSNWQQLDALLGGAGIVPTRGEWTNSTNYIGGERVFDLTNGLIYRAIPPLHTSSPTGTFADERIAHPDLWQTVALSTPFYRGAWQPATFYAIGDLVNVSDYAYYLCVYSHTSGATFSTAYWQLVFDATQVVTDATDARDAAQVSADAAAASQVEAAANETAAVGAAMSAMNAANAALGSANLADQDAQDAAASEQQAIASAAAATDAALSATISAGNALTSANAAAVSAADAALQAAALRGTSLTSHTIFVGSKVFVTQAGKQFNPGNFMIACNAAAPATNWMFGQITAYSGTSLTLNVIMISGATGTFADWQLYISGAQGQGGVIWKGSWSAAATYAVNDIVGLSGTSYICKAPHTNQTPPNAAYWDVMAQGGAAAVADDSITPIKLDAGTPPKQIAFRDRLNFVSRAGDAMTGGLTMAGNLVVAKADATFTLNSTNSGYNTIIGQDNGSARWSLFLGNSGAAGNDFVVYRHDSGGTGLGAAMSINRATGYVNIGPNPTVPASILHVTANDAVVGPSLASSLILHNISLTAGNSNSIVFATKDAPNTSFVHGAWISANYSARGTGTVTASLGFYTSNNTPAPTERMRIDNAGNVGIGTTTPGYMLSLSANFRNHFTVYNPIDRGFIEIASGKADANGNIVGQLSFITDAHPVAGDKQLAAILSSSSGSVAGNRGGMLRLFVKADGGASLERMYIDQNGQTTFLAEPLRLAANTNARFNLYKANGTGSLNCGVNGYTGTNETTGLRWSIQPGDATSETGSNVGSDLSIHAFDDNGAYIGTPFKIKRNTREVLLGITNPTDNAAAASKSYVDGWINTRMPMAGGVFTGDIAPKSTAGAVSQGGIGTFQVTGVTGAGNAAFMSFHRPSSYAVNFGLDTDNQLKIGGSSMGAVAYRIVHEGLASVSLPGSLGVSGAVTISGTISCNAINGTNISGTILSASSYFFTGGGQVYIQSPGVGSNAFLYYRDSAGTARNVAYWESSSDKYIISTMGGPQLVINQDGSIYTGVGTFGRAGTTGAYTGYRNNFFWTAPLQYWTENTNVGNVSITSDYRTKKDVADLTSMWDKVKTLRPISYTQRDFMPPATAALHVKERQEAAKRAADRGVPMSKEDLEEKPPMFRANNIEQWGFIAHELQEALLPSAATGVKDAPDVVQSPNLAPLLAAVTKALQEAMSRIEQLETRLATLEATPT